VAVGEGDLSPSDDAKKRGRYSSKAYTSVDHIEDLGEENYKTHSLLISRVASFELDSINHSGQRHKLKPCLEDELSKVR
jgi:hypothetical protein